jgi:hypothetical protein
LASDEGTVVWRSEGGRDSRESAREEAEMEMEIVIVDLLLIFTLKVFLVSS